MHTKQGLSSVILVIIIAILLGGGYVAYRASQQPGADYLQPTTDNSPQEKQASADANDWKTYSNEKYGFEFRYPQEWILNDPEVVIIGDTEGKFLVSLIRPENKVRLLYARTQGPNEAIASLSNIDFYVSYCAQLNSDCARGGQWLGMWPYKDIPDLLKDPARPRNLVLPEVKVGDLVGYGANEYHSQSSNYMVMIEHNGIYLISFPSTPVTKALGSIERQILSTFKFTK